MKISSRFNVALAAVVDLALQEENTKHLTVQEVAQLQGVSISYLEQIFSQLREADLVKGVRGPGGGYRLSKSPQLISVADILVAVDGVPNVDLSNTELSVSKTAVNVANNALFQHMKGITIRSIVNTDVKDIGGIV